ncbi:MAG: AsnC family transcriptional regulator [Promethearchaeota archaeon]
MDEIDKRLIFELLVDYRASYQSMAKKLDLSVNAVKKRFERLRSVGIIRGGLLAPVPSMIGSEDWVAILRMEGLSTSEEQLARVGAHRLVRAGSILTDGSILCFGIVGGAKDLQEIGSYLRQVPGVESVEFHTILNEPGKRCELTMADLKVLRCLRQEPRIPISEIAQLTGLTPRRIRKILINLLGENGAEITFHLNWEPRGVAHPNEVCFRLSVWWNLNAGGYTAFIIKIRHAEGTEARSRIVNWLKCTYPFKFWYAYASAFEPVIFCIFMVEHLHESIDIASAVTQLPEAVDVYPIFGYPTKVFRSQIDDYFEALFKQLEAE